MDLQRWEMTERDRIFSCRTRFQSLVGHPLRPTTLLPWTYSPSPISPILTSLGSKCRVETWMIETETRNKRNRHFYPYCNRWNILRKVIIYSLIVVVVTEISFRRGESRPQKRYRGILGTNLPLGPSKISLSQPPPSPLIPFPHLDSPLYLKFFYIWGSGQSICVLRVRLTNEPQYVHRRL